MAKSLQEYAEWLDERDLPFPAPPNFESANATPYLKPMKGIRAVTWSIYGTLLRVSEGELSFVHPDAHQMQVALDKTVQEFNMWNSMHRTPIPPWEQLSERYKTAVDDQQMAGTSKKGEYPEVDTSRVWRTLLRQLGEKEYAYDMEFYGDPEEFNDKVAYFFHANCQGVEASENALNTLTAVTGANFPQGLLANAQPFTMVQMLRALKEQGTLPPLASMLYSTTCPPLMSEVRSMAAVALGAKITRSPWGSYTEKCSTLAGAGMPTARWIRVSAPQRMAQTSFSTWFRIW